MATLIVSVPVPISGDGIAVNVSSLVGEKTVTLSGTFKGQYVLFGSHNGTSFSPLATFDAGGVEGIERTFKGAVSWVRIRAMVTESSGVTANVSGLSIPGDNSFGIFPLLTPGSSGTQPSVDLGLVAYQGDVNFIAQGGVKGAVVIEGSQDNIYFNPIGSFSAEPSSSSLLGGSSLVFSPLSTDDRIRYVRLNVRGIILTPFEITIGGSQTSTGAGGGETLHETYEIGVSSIDQTLRLLDVYGGKVIFDASDPGFTASEAVQVIVPGGTGASFPSDGGLLLGPHGDIRIGNNYSQAFAGPGGIAIGSSAYASLWEGGVSISIGTVSAATDYYAIALGESSNALDEYCIAVGYLAAAGVGDDSAPGAIAVGYGAHALAEYGIAIGVASIVIGEADIMIGRQAQALDVLGGKVGIGWGVQVKGASSIAIGYLAVVDTIKAGLSIAIGDQARCQADASIAVGSSAVGIGDDTIAIGSSTTTGMIGDTDNISIGRSASSGSSTVPNDANMAIGPDSSVVGSNSIAFGVGAVVNGDDGLAFGRLALAGAKEIVFSSAAAGGAKKFEVVSDDASNSDLFKFLSTITSIDETGFYLLRKSHTAGNIELKQVTLTAPVGGFSFLQVANT